MTDAITKLTLFYDARCGICSRARRWLAGEPAYVAFNFVDYHSDRAREILPGIDKLHPDQKIVVLADTGAIYQGAKAWVICLWATRKWREWSLRLASPALLPLTERFIGAVSNNRHGISKWLGFRSDAEPKTLRRILAGDLINSECRDGICALPEQSTAAMASISATNEERLYDEHAN